MAPPVLSRPLGNKIVVFSLSASILLTGCNGPIKLNPQKESKPVVTSSNIVTPRRELCYRFRRNANDRLFSRAPDGAICQIGPSTDGETEFDTSYLVWRKDRFVHVTSRYRKNDDGKTTKRIVDSAKEYDMRDGQVTPESIKIEGEKLILPTGVTIEGPTGNVFNMKGELLRTIRPPAPRPLPSAANKN